jgi:nuclear pore complex protein Nup54
MDARRKHLVLKQRCLALATKVQVLRNRGYAMGGDEEVLRTKLMALEKNVADPGVDARSEEIWARMLIVQQRAKLLKSEIEKSGSETFDILDEEMSRRAKKVCFHIPKEENLLNFGRYWRTTTRNCFI